MPIRGEPRGDREINPDVFVHLVSEIQGDNLLSGSSTRTTINESTLTEEDLLQAIDSLRMTRRVSRPMNDYENQSWTLATAVALYKVLEFQMSIDDTSLMGGKTLRTNLRFPLGRDSIDQSVATIVTNEDIRDTDRLEFRVRTMESLLRKHFDTLAVWVDIAKRAKEEYKVEDLLKIENIEQRMAALRIFGPEKLIEETQAKLVSKSERGNELYRIPKEQGFFDEDAYYLKYKCVSTDRIYVSGVPSWLFNLQMAAISTNIQEDRNMMNTTGFVSWTRPHIQVEDKYLNKYPEKDFADLAMAWKFRLTLEEYKALSREHEG